jgi:hypothetical protein
MFEIWIGESFIGDLKEIALVDLNTSETRYF